MKESGLRVPGPGLHSVKSHAEPPELPLSPEADRLEGVAPLAEAAAAVKYRLNRSKVGGPGDKMREVIANGLSVVILRARPDAASQVYRANGEGEALR
jgi:hypothetical protein